MTQPTSPDQPAKNGQKERVPTKQPYLEASDPWKTTNTQQLSAREKLAQIKQQTGPARAEQAQPQKDSAREKLAQMQQKQGPAKQPGMQQKQQQQGIER